MSARSAGGLRLDAFGAALASALLAGVVVAWTPRYWGVSVAITAIALLGLVRAFTARRFELPPHLILVVPIGVWGFLQLVLRESVLPYVTLRNAVVWATCAVAFFLGAQVRGSRRARRTFLDVFLVTTTLLAVVAMLQIYIPPHKVFWLFPANDYTTGTFLYRNYFAALMELAAPVALWQVAHGRITSGSVCFTVLFAATVATASRAGVVLVVGELLLFFVWAIVVRRSVRTFLPVMAILAAMVGGGYLVAGPDRILKRFSGDNQLGVRKDLRDDTLKMIAERPWTGYGMGTWRTVYPRFANFDLALFANSAHNDLAEWASEGGVPFLAAIVALTVWLAWPAFRSVWGIGLLAVMVHSSIDYPTREPVLALIWFTFAGALPDASVTADNE